MVPTAGNPVPTPPFQALNTFLHKRPMLHTLKLCVEMPANIPEAWKPTAAQHVTTFRDALFARSPRATKIFLKHTGDRQLTDSAMYHKFLAPFAATVESLSLDCRFIDTFITVPTMTPFTALKQLDTGCIPLFSLDFLASIPTLRQLSASIYTRGTRGTSAAAFRTPLQALSLRFINIHGCNVQEGLVGIEQLAGSLTELQIHCNSHSYSAPTPSLLLETAAMHRISQLTLLVSLDITWDHPLDISRLSSLLLLRSLRLDSPYLSSLDCISSMPALWRLHLEGVRLALDISHNPVLEVLVIRSRQLTASVIDMIAAAPRLKHLDLSRCWGVAADNILPLSALTGLNSLSLAHTQVRTPQISYLVGQ